MMVLMEMELIAQVIYTCTVSTNNYKLAAYFFIMMQILMNVKMIWTIAMKELHVAMNLVLLIAHVIWAMKEME